MLDDTCLLSFLQLILPCVVVSTCSVLHASNGALTRPMQRAKARTKVTSFSATWGSLHVLPCFFSIDTFHVLIVASTWSVLHASNGALTRPMQRAKARTNWLHSLLLEDVCMFSLALPFSIDPFHVLIVASAWSVLHASNGAFTRPKWLHSLLLEDVCMFCLALPFSQLIHSICWELLHVVCCMLQMGPWQGQGRWQPLEQSGMQANWDGQPSNCFSTT